MGRPEGLAAAALSVLVLSSAVARADEEATLAATPAAASSALVPVPPASNATVLDLRRALALADQNHPTLLAAEAKLANVRAQLDEAHSAPFSAFSMNAGAGPAPTFRGSSIYTQDREVGLSSNLGMAWQVNVQGTIPIWTFGKITNLWRAAEANVKVSEEEVRKSRNLIHLDVRKAYYGLQLARASKSLLKEASDKLDGALKNMDKRVESGDADDVDLFRLKVARAELTGREAEAEKGERMALAALKFLTGAEGDVDIPPDALRPPKKVVTQPVTSYVDTSRRFRPEIMQARLGVVARSAQADLARSNRLPSFGIGISASYSRAPEITDQLNPFVRDDANYFRYGAAIGMTWNLDFVASTARVREAEAQLAENRQILRFAEGGVSVEVQNAYAGVQEAKKKFDAFSASSKLAKQWMLRVSQGIDVGTSEEKDLVEPARQYALQRYAYLQATLDLNMAMANLALATGDDTLADWGE